MAPGKGSAMYATMHRQPDDLRRVLADGWPIARAVGDAVASTRQCWLVGIGTSFHASLAGRWMLREFGVNAHAVTSFDFAAYPEAYPVGPGDSVLLLSHSGARQYSKAALERAASSGANVFSVGGQTAEHPGSGIVLRTTEQETSATFTSAHLAAMTVLAQVSAGAAEAANDPRRDAHEASIDRLPEQVAAVLAREDELLALAERCQSAHTYAVGAGPGEAAALEAVIKCREAAHVRIDALPLEQFIHGPMICLQPEDQVLLVRASGAAAQREADAAQLFATLGSAVFEVGDTTTGFSVPATRETLSPILMTVPMQILAHHLAMLKGIDPDTFRTHEPRFGEAIRALNL